MIERCGESICGRGEGEDRVARRDGRRGGSLGREGIERRDGEKIIERRREY